MSKKRDGFIRHFKTTRECNQQIEVILNRTDSNKRVPYDDFCSVMGMRMRSKRLELDLTQSEVANEIGITFQQIQKYEGGINAIPTYNLYTFCFETKTDTNWFFSDIKGKNKEPIPFIVDSIEKAN